MIPEVSPGSSAAVFDPKTWRDLLSLHATKQDMFSARTLMTILEGVEQLAAARAASGSSITITRFHASIFERLRQSFNNPLLLKEVGILYMEFQLPGIALKHFDLARQFAPKDRDIEQMQKMATLALAKKATDQPAHSGLGEAIPDKVKITNILRKTTTRIPALETRSELTKTATDLRRRTEAVRKEGIAKTPRIAGPPGTAFTALLAQARAALEQGDLAAAGTALEEAQKTGGPAEPLEELNAQLGILAYDREQFADALGAYLRLRDLRPDIAEGWFNSGLVYQRMANYEEALKAYHEASRLDPESSKIWCNLGTVLFERGEYVEAERAVRRSLALRPEYVRAWDSLAAILGALGKLEVAEHACQQAIQLQPGFHGAWFKLGVIYFQQDNFMAAAEAFNATEDNPEFRAYILHYRTMMAARRGEIDAAFSLLAQAIAADPENPLEASALREIAAALTQLARHQEAAQYYGRVVARQPDDFSAWLGKGTAHHRAEEFDLAHEAYARAAEIEPENPMPWHNLGLLASDLGDHVESARCFKRETELAPEDAKAWYDLGVSLQQLGRDSESNAAFEKAETLVHMLSRRSSDLSAALSIVRRLNLGDRVLRTG